jgi:hypothetical protein
VTIIAASPHTPPTAENLTEIAEDRSDHRDTPELLAAGDARDMIADLPPLVDRQQLRKEPCRYPATRRTIAA